MDIFETKNIKPMLIVEMQTAFDDPNFIYELKLDGERCIAYLDKSSTDLRNKRNIKMLSKVPELSNIHKQIKHRCILDGELIILKNGVPDFFEIQRRSLMSNTFKIQLASSNYPATFTAFDILYFDDHMVMDLPLLERKELLEKNINENERIAVSRYVEEQGIKFYQLAQQNQLEGIVAKRKDSKYYLDKRTKDWIKIKNLLDDDFVICGYSLKDTVKSIALGQYLNDKLIYKGNVSLGISGADFEIIKTIPRANMQPDNFSSQKIIWIEPKLVCTVKFMMKTANGTLRQPVFKGLRNDKLPKDCTIN